jgi:hypothetical protein
MTARNAAFALWTATLVACSDSKPGTPTAVAAFHSADSLRVEGKSSLAADQYRNLSDSFARAHDTASWWRAELWLADALLKQGKRESLLMHCSSRASARAQMRKWQSRFLSWDPTAIASDGRGTSTASSSIALVISIRR